MFSKVIGVVLAAGASSRFGSAKQLAHFGEQTLIANAQSVLLSSPVDGVAVVLGCRANEIQSHILPGVLALVNDAWEEGIASSIRKATEYAISQEATHLLLLVCDQPFVTPCLMERIVSHSKFDSDKIVACSYADTKGVPALFPKSKFNDLLALSGDAGAKSILKKDADVILIDFPEGCSDIDLPSDILSS